MPDDSTGSKGGEGLATTVHEGRVRETEAREPAVREPTPSNAESATTVADDRFNQVPPRAEDAIVLPERFEVRGTLGFGGMGRVVEAFDRTLGRTVAIKLLSGRLRQDDLMRRRFLREARAAAVLRHPSIVTIHDIASDGEYMVMELVRGESLFDRLVRVDRLSPAEVRRLGIQLLDALGAAHAAGIVHRDVKPSNVLLEEPSGIPKLADFGVATFGVADLTSPGLHVGTPAYMAPEQLRGHQVDGRADLYSLAATLFEAVTGRRLHHAPGERIDAAAEVRAGGGDAVLATALARALEEDPAARFADARAFAHALSGPASGVETKLAGAEAPLALRSATVASTTAPPSGTTPPMPGPIQGAPPSRTWLLGAGGLLVVVAAGLFLAQLGPSGPGTAAPTAAAGSGTATGVIVATTAATSTAAPAPVVAILPFDERTGDARLDFAKAGLANLLGTELRRLGGASVGYYRLAEHVPSAASPDAVWLETAGKLGATHAARGVVEWSDAGPAPRLRLSVTLTRLSDGTSTVIARPADMEHIPAAVRSTAAEIYMLVTGHTPATSDAAAPDFEAVRTLQLAIAAIEAHELVRARELLDLALVAAPASPEALYQLTLVAWWSDAPDVEEVGRRALAVTHDDARRGFLEGLVLLVRADYAAAIAHFRALVERHPEDRDTLYGLSEALFHGGFPAEGVRTYRRACARSPRFALGIMHAFGHYIAHDDEEGIAWATEHAGRSVEPRSRDMWRGRVLFARRDWAGALAAFGHAGEAPDHELDLLVTYDSAAVHAITGSLSMASAMLEAALLLQPEARLGLFGLYLARGDTAEADRLRADAIRAADIMDVGRVREQRLLTLALTELPAASVAHLRAVRDALGRALRPAVSRRLEVRATFVLIAHAMGDAAGVAEARGSAFPEIAALGEAAAASLAGVPGVAATHWVAAASHSGDGRFLLIERLYEAAAWRAAGEHESVIAACRDVVEPRVFRWSWGAAVGQCLVWWGDAAVALGRLPEAAAAYDRLLAIRTRAATDDALVTAARAGLARTRAP